MYIAINTSHAHPNEYLMDFTHSQLKFHSTAIYVIRYALLTNSMSHSLLQKTDLKIDKKKFQMSFNHRSLLCSQMHATGCKVQSPLQNHTLHL